MLLTPRESLHATALHQRLLGEKSDVVVRGLEYGDRKPTPVEVLT
jgi:hypothetical protein